jgi:hypothetical protein
MAFGRRAIAPCACHMQQIIAASLAGTQDDSTNGQVSDSVAQVSPQ